MSHSSHYHRNFRPLLASSSILICLWNVACSEPPTEQELEAAAPAVEVPSAAPDILLITIDTLRADRVGAYGDPLAHTPTLDALAANGALFREAHSVSALTLPSHATLLTGLLPSEHGLRDNAGFRMSEEIPTLAEALLPAGYQTGAFVSAYVLDSAWGLDRGFQVYRDPFNPQAVAQTGAFGEVELRSADVINAAIGWWKVSPGPRFGWVHLYDPHLPWKEHVGWEGDPYRGEVHFTDGLIQRLIETVGDDTLIIVTSDHGESLWEYGERDHGVLLGRSITRVPLIIRPPGGLNGTASAVIKQTPTPPIFRPDGIDEDLDLSPVPDAPTAAKVIESTVSGLDIAPTIVDYAQAQLSVPGRSLRPAIEGTTIEQRPVYAETYFPYYHHGWASLHMAQDHQHRLERGAYDVVYDWTVDPFGSEQLDLNLTTLIEAIETGRNGQAPTPEGVDPQTAQALEALGYLTTVVEDAQTDQDPRDHMKALSRLKAAETLTDPTRAISLLVSLIEEYPTMTDAWLSLGLKKAEVGDIQGAYEATLTVLNERPNHATALQNAAYLALNLGDPEQSVKLAERMIQLNAVDARGYRILTAVWESRNNHEQVKTVTAAGLEQIPDDPFLLYHRGMAEKVSGEALSAIPYLERAERSGSSARDIRLQIAHAYELAERIDEAGQAYLQAAKTAKSIQESSRSGAMGFRMLANHDRCEEAKPLLAFVPESARGNPQIQNAMQRCGLR